MKRLLSVLLMMTMLVGVFAVAPVGVSASAETDRIVAQIKSTYSKSLSLSGRSSFNGYCGAYVRYQIMALDIISEPDSDVRGDGNKIFGNVKEGTTSKGYNKIKYSGNDCIRNIINSNTGNIYNVLVSWTYQYGYSASNPGAGHATFIHAIIDGVVYFSESYATRGVPEGGVHTCTVSEFYSRYNGSYGDAIGAVHFTTAHTHSYDTYVYNWDSHPHYKCYKCSCGDVKENTNEPTYVESCEYCNTHTCNMDVYYSYWEAHPHYYLYECSLCGTVTTDYSQTKRIDSCEYCRVGKTRVYTNKDMYYPGERVILTWDEATYATHYNFYIMKKDSSGEYKERIDWITLLKQTDYYIDGLSAGEYMIELYSYDSTQWEPDGSDWCHERADLIYFAVDENAEIPYDGSITFGSNTYEIYNTTMSWTDAKAYCESQGGHLVTITSYEENEAVRELVASEGGRWCYYMGITDESSEGNWQNITGEPLSYTNWISGEPNNENGVEHYGVVRNLDAENWNDVVNVYKNNPVGFICEYEKESKLILGDADADGKVNVKDATAIQKNIANLITLTEDGYGVADVDASGSVNIKDATAIQKHIAGIDTGYFAE